MWEIILNILNYMGFFNIILPFILVYSIVYGLLSKYKILGDPFDTSNEVKARAVRSIIAMVSASISFFVVGSVNVVINIREIIPYFVLYILVLFMLLLSVSPFLVKSDTGEIVSDNYKKVVGILATVIFFLVALYSFGLISIFSVFGDIFNNTEVLGFIMTMVVLGILMGFVYWITRPVGGSGGSKQGGSGGGNK